MDAPGVLLAWSNIANLRVWVLMRLRFAAHYPDGLTGADIDAHFAAAGITVAEGYVNAQLRALREVGLVITGEPRIRPGITPTPTYTLTAEGQMVANAIAGAINRVINTPVLGDAVLSWSAGDAPADDGEDAGSPGGDPPSGGIPGW